MDSSGAICNRARSLPEEATMRTSVCVVAVLGLFGCKKSEEAKPAATPAPAAATAAPAPTGPGASGEFHSKEGKFKISLPCATREAPKAEENGPGMKESFDCAGGIFQLIDVEWKDGPGGFEECVKHSDESSALKFYKVLSKGDLPGGRGKFWKLSDLDSHNAREWTCIKSGDRYLACDAKKDEKEADATKFVAACETVQPE
jgi:hypothetical protein